MKFAIVGVALAVAGYMGTTTSAVACTGAASTNCTTVVPQQYGGGGESADTIPITACMTQRMYDSIKLRDGTSAWDVGFYYGVAQPEVVRTVRNSGCWTLSDRGTRQEGVVGAWVVAYIDCDYYRGWIGGQIQTDGRANLYPIKLPKGHDPLA